ncbi:(2Fe-2S)-binding protein [Rhodobacteraceae bacterium NNCM2]|nr:(2Fe-2S)-binding protein [Coraliihabitans acroporae]
MSGYRLPSGGAIERSKALQFTWDGERCFGVRGDSLASALMASGKRVVARGFKYHRPRGIMTAGPEEGGAIVTVGDGARREPNAKAPCVELFDGLVASGQNAWPNVRFDLGQVNDLMGQFFAAGFYYKTFMGLGRGTWEWMQFEKLIRRAAGMGSASHEADPDSYEYVHDFCDVLVVGAGPAGLAAAEACVAKGLDVMVVEQDFAMGGALLAETGTVDGQGASDWIKDRIAALSGARLMPRTTAFGLYDSNVVGLFERVTYHMPAPDPRLPRGRIRIVRPGQVILATGAIERPFAFGNNDRPGVMFADAAQTYVNRYGVAPGRRAVVATNNDSAYGPAMAMAAAGIETVLLDSRDMRHPLAEAAEAAGITWRQGTLPVEVKGRKWTTGLAIGRLGRHGHARIEEVIDTDIVAISGGWSPAIHLVSHRGVKPEWNAELACFLSGEPPEGVALTGAAAGQFTTEGAIAHARAVASRAIKALTDTGRRARLPEPGGWETPIEPLWEVTLRDRKLKSFVDPQHDVGAADVKQAAAEGYASVEHMKRYTTLGMATDQGKMGGVIGLALLADALDQTIPETGITTFRPPYTPVPIGAFAGRSKGHGWKPIRRTPMHEVQEGIGFRFLDVGLWKRAWWQQKSAGEDLAGAYVREATNVRQRVGMVDVTTLGKISVQGPDAGEFLNRVYVNGFGKLPVGKCRYGVMLRDDGIVFDDGVTWRLGEEEFLMTCTTANAAPVMAWLENLLQSRWPDLRVHVASTTDQWAGVAVAGPKARDVIQPVITGDLSNESVPFMGILETEMKVPGGKIPVLIARISFSGEMAYEVYAPSDYGPAMWQTLLPEVEAAGGSAYGVEALGALRIEKGHVTGAELDGRVTLEDAGLGKMASSKKPFIGNVLRKRPDLARGDRPQLAHFVPVIKENRFKIGAIVCEDGKEEGHGLGWITGVTVAPALDGQWLGIGFIAGGPAAWEGKTVTIADPVRNASTKARVMSPHQYDPKGERMHG